MEALIIVAHGSRREDSHEVMERIRQDVASQVPYHVRLGYLQLQHPRLEEVIASLWQEGIRKIVVVPAFLSYGAHVVEDIPAILQAMVHRYPGVEFFLAEPLGYDPRLAAVLLDRVQGKKRAIR
ncbi:MAG: CbiX/SirB N-terminal domain-containing protein [Atribacterota bacterium]